MPRLVGKTWKDRIEVESMTSFQTLNQKLQSTPKDTIALSN